MVQSICVYSLERLREDAIALIQNGCINSGQPIYTLSQYLTTREWLYAERELEEYGFLLRDRISELVGQQKWSED
ncbi:MAG: DUF4327 family protein [Pleurocapsa sp.]